MQKATISFVMPVCVSILLSVCPHGATLLHVDGLSWNLMFEYFLKKSFETIQVSLKSDKIMGTLHDDLCTFVIVAHWILLRMRNFSDKSCIQNQKRILWSITFFFPENRAPAVQTTWTALIWVEIKKDLFHKAQWVFHSLNHWCSLVALGSGSKCSWNTFNSVVIILINLDSCHTWLHHMELKYSDSIFR